MESLPFLDAQNDTTWETLNVAAGHFLQTTSLRPTTATVRMTIEFYWLCVIARWPEAGMDGVVAQGAMAAVPRTGWAFNMWHDHSQPDNEFRTRLLTMTREEMRGVIMGVLLHQENDTRPARAGEAPAE